MANILRNLIDVATARKLTSENIRVEPGTEEVPLEESIGRVITGDILSPINTPPFDRSIKDGVAVISDDVAAAGPDSEVRLKIVGSVDIGSEPSVSIESGQCVRIPTGGVMPEGADSVVMVEFVRDEPPYAIISRSVAKGENVALAGSDTPMGELIVRRGTRIGPRELAVLSSLGIARLKVRRRIRIGIVSTGDELVPPGEQLSPGKIYESNGRSIKALVDQERGAFNATFYGTLPDDEQTIREALDRYASENDILVVSGSTSAGEKDVVYRILGSYSPGTVFHGVMVKPGKPTLLSMNGKKAVIGLPGFPVSAMMTFLAIFFPYILREAGISRNTRSGSAVMAAKVTLDMGKLNLIPVTVVDKGGYIAFPIYGGSGSISRILRADGYVAADGGSRILEEGEEVPVTMFGPNLPGPGIVLTAESSLSLESFYSAIPGETRIIRAGHSVALASLDAGYSDAAGLILPLEGIGQSSGPFSDGDESHAILWESVEEVGVVLSPYNVNVEALEEVLAATQVIAVPTRSDGSTPIIDGILSSTGDAGKISRAEIGDFNSVAFSVSRGYYAAGFSDRATAAKYGLRFVPAGKFRYVVACLNGNEHILSNFHGKS